MTDPTQAGQPSEEELRAYLEQLRTADPAEVLVQAYRMLGTGAEVKLGRQDARVLIDAMQGLVEAADGRIQAELVQQMRDGVGQLQTAQVQAEREAAQGPEGAAGARQPAGEPAGAGPEEGSAGTAGAPGREEPGAGQRMTDRLWIPGRDPKPG